MEISAGVTNATLVSSTRIIRLRGQQQSRSFVGHFRRISSGFIPPRIGFLRLRTPLPPKRSCQALAHPNDKGRQIGEAARDLPTVPAFHRFEDSRYPQKGDFGDDVRALQEYLLSEGFFESSDGCTGYFGDKTVAALQKWQESNGLPATGKFGPMSIGVYNIRMEAKKGIVRDTADASRASGDHPQAGEMTSWTPSPEPSEARQWRQQQALSYTSQQGTAWASTPPSPAWKPQPLALSLLFASLVGGLLTTGVLMARSWGRGEQEYEGRLLDVGLPSTEQEKAALLARAQGQTRTGGAATQGPRRPVAELAVEMEDMVSPPPPPPPPPPRPKRPATRLPSTVEENPKDGFHERMRRVKSMLRESEVKALNADVVRDGGAAPAGSGADSGLLGWDLFPKDQDGQQGTANGDKMEGAAPTFPDSTEPSITEKA